MIKNGILVEYDDNVGIIKDKDNREYIVLKKDIISNEIKVNDIVKFEHEVVITSEEDKNIARFISKLTLKR